MYASRHAVTSITLAEDDFTPAEVATGSLAAPHGAEATKDTPLAAAAAFAQLHQSIYNAGLTPPVFWRRFRFYLPSTVAELKITPSRPETTVEGNQSKQSMRLVISIGLTPEDPQKYVSEFVTYIFQLSEHLASSAPIFSLRFVKIGMVFHQCLLDFGTDASITQKFAGCLREVGFTVGFAPPGQAAPTATMSVLDVKRVLNDGAGATEADVTALFGLPLNELRVIEGFEEGLFFAACKKADVVYAWLCNQFMSAFVQRELFQKFGLLVGAVQAEHSFALKGIPYHLQKKDALAMMQDASYSTLTDQDNTAFENYENQNEADEELQDYLKYRDRAVDLFAAEISETPSGPAVTLPVLMAMGGIDLPPLLDDDDGPSAAAVGVADKGDPSRADDGARPDDMLRWDMPPVLSHLPVLPMPPAAYARGALAPPIMSLLPAPLGKAGPSVLDSLRASQSPSDLQQLLRAKLASLNATLRSAGPEFRPLLVSELMRHAAVGHAELFTVLVSDAGLMQLLASLLEDEKAQVLLASQFLQNVSNANVTHLVVRSLKVNPAVSNPLVQQLAQPAALAATAQPAQMPHVTAMLQAALDAMSPGQQAFLRSTLASDEIVCGLLGGASGRAIFRTLLQASLLQGALCADAFRRPEPLSDSDVAFLVSLLNTPRVNTETAALLGALLLFIERKDVSLASAGLGERLASAVLTGKFLPDGKAAFCKIFFDPREAAPPGSSTLRQMLSAMHASDVAEKVPTGFRLALPTAAAKPADAKSQEACPLWGTAMATYPAVGYPFPPAGGFSVHLSRSHGHYFFKSSSGDKTSYKHPGTGKGFPASPQAFFRDAGLEVAAVASDAGVAVPDVERWLQDQRIRNATLDTLVMERLGIRYHVATQTQQPPAAGPVAVAKETALASRYAAVLATFAQAPKRGHMFPPLPKGWSCNLSTSHGLYYFRPPAGDPVYFHPVSSRECHASPQAFALHLKLPVPKIVAACQVSADTAQAWLDDQRVRNTAIDSFVLKELDVRYKQDEPKREASRRRKRSRGY